jgi:ferredoxin
LAPDQVKNAYKLIVDVSLASLMAITLYPFAGNRVWCRFFCPLAKWIELWGRWTGGKLAIVPNEECISCGECTRHCQMGIDVRAFASRGMPLSNQTTCCIFCGICVTVCPVDVLRVEMAAGSH